MKQLDVWLIVDRMFLSTPTASHTARRLSYQSSPPSPLPHHQPGKVVPPSPSHSSSRCASILDGGFSLRLYPPSRNPPTDGATTTSTCGTRPFDARLEQRCFVAQRPGNEQVKLTFKSVPGAACRVPVEFGSSSTMTSSNSSLSPPDVIVDLSCIGEWPSDELQYWYVVALVSQSPTQLKKQAQLVSTTTTTTTTTPTASTSSSSKMSSVWTLRLPVRMRKLEDSFTAHLYAGAVSPMTSLSGVVDRLVTTYRLDAVRNPPRPVTSLCLDDDNEAGCQSATICNEVSTAIRCARTCGVCNASRPAPCSLDSSWGGVWRDVGVTDDVTLRINQTDMSLAVGRQQVAEFHCVSWQQPGASVRSKKGGGVTEAMFVKGRGNGCRLQFVCVRMARRSPSVAYIRYSRVMTWPFDSITSLADPIDCRLFTFDQQPGVEQHRTSTASSSSLDDVTDSIVGVLDSTRHWRVLYTAEERSPVRCLLPTYAKSAPSTAMSNWSSPDFGVSFPDGTRCTSGGVEEVHSGLSLRMSMSGCTNAAKVLFPGAEPLAHGTYSCLLSTALSPASDGSNRTIKLAQFQQQMPPDHVIWTRAQPLYQTSSSVAGILHCWLFRRGSPESGISRSIQVFEASRCPSVLFVSLRRRAGDDLLHRLSAGVSTMASAVFSSKPTRPSDESSPTVDSLSSLNHRRAGIDERPLTPSRTKHHDDGDHRGPSVNVTNELFEEAPAEVDEGGELVLAVSIIVFIICAYVPCIYRST